jgi:sialate O-acetylesterase
MSIYGVIWYQGEANSDYNLDYYNCTFPTLVSDWRRKWLHNTNGSTNPELPFGFVQIANYQNESESKINDSEKISTLWKHSADGL